MKYTIDIRKTPDTNDADNVIFFGQGNIALGSGYKVKKTEKVCVIICPVCKQENYAANIPTGYCSWCGFNANE